MTRLSLYRTLRRLYLFILLILAISLLAKFADHIAFFKAIGLDAPLKDIYEFLRDMSLLIATGGVAYVSNVYQRRSSFVTSLQEEWRNLVATKSALYAYCEKPYPTADEYIATFCRLSETIDNMRIVYRNVGETDDLVGLYPYTPLHDMRRVLMTLDPRKSKDIAPDYRRLARDSILQSFYALRETFLEELDLEEPDHPLLISGARRLKVPGATTSARRHQDRQIAVLKAQAAAPTSGRPAAGIGRREDIDNLLAELHQREQAGGA